MKAILFIESLLLLALLSCAPPMENFRRSEYRKSRPVATYSGMANEFEDGFLVLKENGYFRYYHTFWLLVNIRESSYRGRYTESHDTLYLSWPVKDPRQIKPFLSRICIRDSAAKTLWFVDEKSGERLWGLHR